MMNVVRQVRTGQLLSPLAGVHFPPELIFVELLSVLL